MDPMRSVSNDRVAAVMSPVAGVSCNMLGHQEVLTYTQKRVVVLHLPDPIIP